MNSRIVGNKIVIIPEQSVAHRPNVNEHTHDWQYPAIMQQTAAP
jgi:hypothetical protein